MVFESSATFKFVSCFPRPLFQPIALFASQDEVDAELLQMEIGNAGAKGSLRELITKWRTPLVITTTLAVFQQLTGHANVVNFAGDIFRMSGFRGAAPAVVLGVVKVVATVLAIVLVRNLQTQAF